MTLEEFLAARLAETWAVARDRELAAGLNESLATRAVDAGRQILALHPPGLQLDADWCPKCQASWPCQTVRACAAVWSDHPDYDESWRP